MKDWAGAWFTVPAWGWKVPLFGSCLERDHPMWFDFAAQINLGIKSIPSFFLIVPGRSIQDAFRQVPCAPNPVLKNEPTKCSSGVRPLDLGFGNEQKNGLDGIIKYHQDNQTIL